MFHCLVIKVVSPSSLCDSLFTLSHLFHLVKNFFQKFLSFFEIFKSVCFCHSVLATRLLYHKFSRLSTVILNYLKSYLLFSISEAIPCDSSFTIPLPKGNVKHFLQIFLIYFVQPVTYTLWDFLVEICRMILLAYFRSQ